MEPWADRWSEPHNEVGLQCPTLFMSTDRLNQEATWNIKRRRFKWVSIIFLTYSLRVRALKRQSSPLDLGTNISLWVGPQTCKSPDPSTMSFYNYSKTMYAEEIGNLLPARNNLLIESMTHDPKMTLGSSPRTKFVSMKHFPARTHIQC